MHETNQCSFLFISLKDILTVNFTPYLTFLNIYVHDAFNLYTQLYKGAVCQDIVEAIAVVIHQHL